MNLANPWGLLAAGLAGPLVVWYVLRSRRPRVTVGSTFLWERTERSVAAAVPWQRFRGDVTFWLVLLALLAGALSLSEPYVTVTAELGDHTILVVDASASMLAIEDGPTRLELARREADELIGRMGGDQTMSIVEAAARGRVVISSSGDPAALSRALASIRPTHGGADLVDAFTLVAALERPGQSTVVHLLSDGVVPESAASSAPAGLLVRAVGRDRPNLAVTRLQAVPVGAGTNQVFVQVRNLGTLPATARLSLSVTRRGETDEVTRAAVQDVVLEQELRLGPRGTEDLVLSVPGGDGDVLVAAVEPTGTDVATGADAADALSLDDRAFAVLAAPRELTVVIAGPGNVFLEAALASLPGADVLEVETVPAVPADLVGVDVLVVDRVAAPAAPTVPTLLLSPTSYPAGVDVGSPVELPAITFQAAGHELLTDVDLSDVAIAEAPPLSAPALAPIASGPSGDLILAGRLDGAPVVAVGFDIFSSNLPLQAAWPVLVANTVSWLAGPPQTESVPAGSTTVVAAPTGTEELVVHPPSNATHRVDATRPRVTVDEVGLWSFDALLEDGGTTPAATVLAVNPNPDESDLAREQPDPVEARDAAEAGRTAGASEGRRVFGREIALGVLALALLEWLYAFWWVPARVARAEVRRRGEPHLPVARRKVLAGVRGRRDGGER